ncbi:MAG: hypothetical protein OES84_00060 [Kiritimatiellaceae bacterium]|nr:hypothetical protein [Kiritimatiellaceae bacterium]
MAKQYKTLPLLGSDRGERSGSVSAERNVNLWSKLPKTGSKSPIVLYPTPGYTSFSATGESPNRGNGVTFNGYFYFVASDSLVQISQEGINSIVGTFDTSSGRVQMVVGRDYLMVTDGGNGWTWDGTTFAKITDPDFPASPSHCAYADNYFIVNKGGSDEFYISAVEDPTSWGGLDFEAASAVPDNATALTSNRKDLYILGSASVQVYYNSGNEDFPYVAYTGGTLDFGILAPHSLVDSSAGIFFLATAREGGIAVVQLNGFQAQIISSDISWDLDGLTTTEDAEAFVYRIGERTIYQITFPTEARTFEYVIDYQSWTERKTYDSTRYAANGHAFLDGKNIIGEYDSGTFYLLDEEVYTDDGTAIERIRVTQPIHSNHNLLKFSAVVVEIESGVGLVAGQGSDPLMMMRYSDNGGKTWSSELTASMGKIGEYGIILEWTKLGLSRSRIFEFKVTDPVKVVIVNAYARVTVL